MADKKITIQGIAIVEGVSRNGIMYTANELQKFAPTLKGRPILKDHANETDKAIGLVTESNSFIDEGKTKVRYKGWVKEDGTGIVEKMLDERIKEVSIGAIAGKMVKEKEDSEYMIAKNLVAIELSTTPCPGVIGTSLGIKNGEKSLKNFNEGGAGSGNFGHAGVPGQVGGSGPVGGSSGPGGGSGSTKGKSSGNYDDEYGSGTYTDTKSINDLQDDYDAQSVRFVIDSDEEVDYDKTTNSEGRSYWESSRATYNDYEKDLTPRELKNKIKKDKNPVGIYIKQIQIKRNSKESNSQNIVKIINQKEVKMESENKEKVVDANAVIAQENAMLKKQIVEMNESVRQQAISTYKKIVESKGLKAVDVTNATMETIKALTEMVESFEAPKVVVSETKKAETKTNVVKESNIEEQFKGYVIEQSDLGGYAFYKSN